METASKRRAGILFAYLVMVAVNVMANALPIAGTTTGAVSDKYASMFTPAGYTFSIWGLIYLALGGFVIYQALPAQRESAELASLGRPFILSCAANAAWLIFWHLEWLFPSLIMMVVLLGALVTIYRRLDVSGSSVSVAKRAFTRWPFSLYLGWISVALIANASAFQSALYWNDALIGEVRWTVIKLAIAGAIGATMVLRYKDSIFALVVAWAAIGIAARADNPLEVPGGAAAIGVMLVLLVVGSALAARIRV